MILYIFIYIYTHIHTQTHTDSHNGILLNHIKNNEILPFASTLMDLGGILLSEISEKGKRDQDGREKGWSSPPLPHERMKKYIYMWNNSHWKLTGDWQKDSSTAQAVRNIHMWSDRKGRKVIRSEPVPLGRNSENKEGNKGGHLPWGVNRLSHRWGFPVLWFYMEEISSLGWLSDCCGKYHPLYSALLRSAGAD